MKILLVGAQGQLGTELRAVYERRHWEVIPMTRELLDIRDVHSIRQWLTLVRPDWVVNTAAYHRTDECEDHPEEAFAVNATAVGRLATESSAVGARFVHFSTDYVFDGLKHSPYLETDPPNPLNIYGASKLAGEYLARIAAPDCLIVRTSGMFGVTGSKAKGGNFIDRIARQARNGNTLRIVADVRFSPTYAVDLALSVARLMEQGASGLFHIANQGETTWAAFARAALDALGIPARIDEVSLSDISAKAKRPAYSVLGMERLRAMNLPLPRPWEDALCEFATRVRGRAK